MPLGIVSNEDFERELSKATPIKSELITPVLTEVLPLDETTRGRSKGDKNVPSSLRKLIGDIAVTEGRQEALALARDFGISASSASAYANGSTSTKTYDKTPNRSHINQAKERIGLRARAKLRKALTFITDDKLAASDAKDLAAVVKSLSSVSKDMEPSVESSGDGKPAVAFQVFSPTVVQENHFQTINAREEIAEK